MVGSNPLPKPGMNGHGILPKPGQLSRNNTGVQSQLTHGTSQREAVPQSEKAAGKQPKRTDTLADERALDNSSAKAAQVQISQNQASKIAAIERELRAKADDLFSFLKRICYDDGMLDGALIRAMSPLPAPAICKRARDVWYTQEFQTFYEGMGSRVLIFTETVANGGNNGSTVTSTFATTTYIDARDKVLCIRLIYLCRQYPGLSPKDIIINLLGQIIKNGNFEKMVLPPTPSDDSFQTLLTTLINCIIAQLDKTKIVCVIDSCSTYETAAYAGDMKELLRRLAGVTVFNKTHPFKLLVTSQDPFRSFDQYMHGGRLTELRLQAVK